MFEDAQDSGWAVKRCHIGSSTFTLAPQAGCRLMRWEVRSHEATREVLYWPDDCTGMAPAAVRGGNPILFPFAGRSFHKGLENNWRHPDGEVLPMPRNGFARSSAFHIVEQTDHSLTAELEPDSEARQAYPFLYRFRVRYTFSELALQVDLLLRNEDKQPIPWSAGHHFYFTLPWHRAARRNDYQLHMEARKAAYPGPDGTLVAQKLRDTCHDFADPALSDRIHWDLRRPVVSFGPKSGEQDVHLRFTSAHARSHAVVTWTESAGSPFYCIEPWMGPANAAGHGNGLHWVEQGSEAAFSVELSLF
jgi:galactose mutarotase-like enzyme